MEPDQHYYSIGQSDSETCSQLEMTSKFESRSNIEIIAKSET